MLAESISVEIQARPFLPDCRSMPDRNVGPRQGSTVTRVRACKRLTLSRSHQSAGFVVIDLAPPLSRRLMLPLHRGDSSLRADPPTAQRSARAIYKTFIAYLDDDDFVGADMARKFLQMGYTRARSYANYKGGRKYDKDNGYRLQERGTGDPEKAESAAIFYEYWKKAESEKRYDAQKRAWKGSIG
jgi:Domain of unknown function (DUF4385)